LVLEVPVRRALLMSCLVLGGCPEEDPSSIWYRETDQTDSGSDTEAQSLCPTGMHQPSAVDVSITFLALNGIARNTTFDSNTALDGTASACSNDDGQRVQVLIYANGEPLGWWTSGSTETGGLTIGTDGDLIFDAFGHDPVTTFDSQGWTSGTWSIGGGSSSVTHSVNAQAAVNGQFLVLMGSINVTP
jgi:hypothetical protein